MKKIVVITGPTASGKTALALYIANRYGAEIVNGDSVSFYKYMDIGSAKPDKKERKLVKHHLIDIVKPENHFTAYDFMKKGDKAIEKIVQNKKIPLIVGGSPLYIKALLYGFFDMDIKIDPNLRENIKNRLKVEGNLKLHQELEKIDPESAIRIHPNDTQRLERALEVYYSSGKTITEFQNEHKFEKKRYQYIKFAVKLDRELLYERINKRVDIMLEKGLLSEVENLLKMGYHPDNDKIMRSIGYKELVQYIENKVSLKEAIENVKKNTRHFAKRQLTWLKKEKEIVWLNSRNFQTDLERYMDIFRK